MFIDNLKSEFRKLMVGRGLFWFLVAGSGFTILSAIGALVAGKEGLESPMGIELASTGLLRAWFALSLVIAMFGAYYVARDFSTGAASRAVILGGGRGKFVLSKIFAGAIIGLIGGLLGGVLSVAVGNVLMAVMGKGFSISSEGWLVLLGCFVTNLVAGIWGVLIGLLVRTVTIGLFTVLALCLLVEPALQRIAPEFGRFFMTNAMGSLYLDIVPGLLSVPSAAFAIAGWLGALGAAAVFTLSRRDLD